MDRVMYAVICDAKSTELVKFSLTGRLSELDDEGKKELIEWLAENYDAWKDVLKGTRAGVIFDGETMDKIRYNKGVIDLRVNL